MRYYNIKQLSDVLEVEQCTIRTWLGHYNFSKYIVSKVRPLTYAVDEHFCSTLLQHVVNRKCSPKITRVINNVKYMNFISR